MSVSIDVVYEGELACLATHGPSGRAIVTDAPVDNGGRGAAFSPTDLVAAALGSCMLTIMGIAATRIGRDLAGTRVEVVKEMVSRPVRRISTLTARVFLQSDCPLSARERVSLEAAAVACPVKQSLHPDVQVKIEFVYGGRDPSVGSIRA